MVVLAGEAIVPPGLRLTVLTSESHFEEAGLPSRTPNSEAAVIPTTAKAIDPLRDLGGSEDEDDPFWPWLQREAEKSESTQAASWNPGSQNLEVRSILDGPERYRADLVRAVDACFLALAQDRLADGLMVKTEDTSAAIDDAAAPEEIGAEDGWLFVGLTAVAWSGIDLSRDERKRRSRNMPWRDFPC